MGLADLIDDDDEDEGGNGNNANFDWENEKTDTPEKSEPVKVSTTREDRNVVEIEKGVYLMDIPDISAGFKYCPECTAKSPKLEKPERLHYECPNPNCQVRDFSSGWNDMHSEDEFLGGIEWDDITDEVWKYLEKEPKEDSDTGWTY